MESSRGLSGMYAHKLNDDQIQYQMRILRRLGPERWIVQFFSFLDGEETNCGVIEESELIGPNYRLYANSEQMNYAYDKESRGRKDA